MAGFISSILHSDDSRKDAHGALRFPIYECAAFGFDSAEQLGAAFDGSGPAHAYSRVSNPTVEAFERRIATMAGAVGALAFSSGMAAITTLVLTLCQSGSSIVASKFLFGNTVSLFEKTLGPWGLTVRWVDGGNLDEVAAAIDQTTRMVFVETISNPQIAVVDVGALSRLCAARDVVFVLDNSLATSWLLRSKDYGVALEIVSSAKYLSGGGTSVGGLVIDNGVWDWNRVAAVAPQVPRYGQQALVRSMRSSVARNVGACLSPHAAYLQMLGMETLALRIERSSVNALVVAQFLESHDGVAAVHYPGLCSSPWHALSQRQFRGGLCGGLLSFELAEGMDAQQFLNRLRLVKRSSNFNDNKSLIIHPRSTLFCEYTKEKRAAMGISDQLLRLSVGIEEVEDIVEDMSQALGSG
jgi:O-acetylhomoserine (thiol)-lyase